MQVVPNHHLLIVFSIHLLIVEIVMIMSPILGKLVLHNFPKVVTTSASIPQLLILVQILWRPRSNDVRAVLAHFLLLVQTVFVLFVSFNRACFVLRAMGLLSTTVIQRLSLVHIYLLEVFVIIGHLE